MVVTFSSLWKMFAWLLLLLPSCSALLEYGSVMYPYRPTTWDGSYNESDPNSMPYKYKILCESAALKARCEALYVLSHFTWRLYDVAERPEVAAMFMVIQRAASGTAVWPTSYAKRIYQDLGAMDVSARRTIQEVNPIFFNPGYFSDLMSVASLHLTYPHVYYEELYPLVQAILSRSEIDAYNNITNQGKTHMASLRYASHSYYQLDLLGRTFLNVWNTDPYPFVPLWSSIAGPDASRGALSHTDYDALSEDARRFVDFINKKLKIIFVLALTEAGGAGIDDAHYTQAIRESYFDLCQSERDSLWQGAFGPRLQAIQTVIPEIFL